MPDYTVVVLDPFTNLPLQGVEVEAHSLSTGLMIDKQSSDVYGAASFSVAEAVSFHARTHNKPTIYQVVGPAGGIGPFCYDCLVDTNWAAIVAAGGGTEGQTFTTFHGHTFKVHSTIEGAITSALAASGDRYTIAVCCDITMSAVADIGGIDKTIFITGLVPALGRKTGDSSDADRGSAPVITAATGPDTHFFVQTTGKSGTDRGLVFSNLGFMGRSGKYVFHVDTGLEIDFLHFENCMFGSISGRMYLAGNELDGLIAMGNLDISITNCTGTLDAFYENNSTPPNSLVAKNNNLFLTKWWTDTNAADNCLIEGGEYIVTEAQTITAHGNNWKWTFKSLKISSGCSGAALRQAATDTNISSAHYSNILFIATANDTDFGDFQGPSANPQRNLYVVDIHGAVASGVVPTGTFLTVDSDQLNPYVADIWAPDWIASGTVYSGPIITPAVPPVIDHGALTGLSDDDHTQYILTAGSRPLTGDWDNIGRRIRNTGVAEVATAAPATPATGLVWLDTDATGTGGLGVLNVATISSSDTLTTSQTVVLCDASGGAITVTLPAASGNDGRHYHIKKIDSSRNAVTIDGNGSETIDGETTQVIAAQYNSINIVCDGSEWFVV